MHGGIQSGTLYMNEVGYMEIDQQVESNQYGSVSQDLLSIQCQYKTSSYNQTHAYHTNAVLSELSMCTYVIEGMGQSHQLACYNMLEEVKHHKYVYIDEVD